MDWLTYIKRETPELIVLPKKLLQRVRKLDPISVENLFASSDRKEDWQDLKPEHLRNLMILQWEWKELTREIARQRNKMNAPKSVWDNVFDKDQVEALKKVGNLLKGSKEESEEKAWMAGLKIWDATFGVARKEATLFCEVPDMEHPRFSHYANFTGNQGELFDLPAHRWFAILQGEQEGVLKLKFDYPLKSLEQQVGLRCSDLGSVIQYRPTRSILEELVLVDLDDWLRYKMSQQARRQAMATACQSYRTLLTQPPLKDKPLVGLYIGNERGKVGLVMVDEKGALQEEASFSGEDPYLVAQVKQKLDEWGGKEIVMPVRAAAYDLHQELSRELKKGYALHFVREAALSTSRERWMEAPHHRSREIASAIALTQRLQQPFEEWSRIDPLALGLAEYRDMLDAKVLQSLFKDEVAMLRHLKKKKEPLKAKRASLPAIGTVNPLVKSLADLKAGMTLKGIVSNLTDFGAFVHIGLKEEGLVHLSELADRFVRHPSEVVTVGQEVSVRVLSVDLPARRISLTMRSQDKPRPRSKQQKKSKALQDLEKLFKK